MDLDLEAVAQRLVNTLFVLKAGRFCPLQQFVGIKAQPEIAAGRFCPILMMPAQLGDK